MAAWWLAARGNRRLPDRRDLDPVDLGPLLPYIWLIEVLPERESCAYRYRLGGQHIEDTFGFSLRGKLLNEVIEPHVYGMVQRRCDHVVKGPGVCHVAGRVYMHVGLYREGERLILPLGPDDAGPATHVLGATVYRVGESPPEERLSETPVIERFLSLEDVAAWRLGEDVTP